MPGSWLAVRRLENINLANPGPVNRGPKTQAECQRGRRRPEENLGFHSEAVVLFLRLNASGCLASSLVFLEGL